MKNAPNRLLGAPCTRAADCPGALLCVSANDGHEPVCSQACSRYGSATCPSTLSCRDGYCLPEAAPPPEPEPVQLITWIPFEGGTWTMRQPPTDDAASSVVEVAPFEIGRSEVTVAQYSACVGAHVCTSPRVPAGETKCTWSQPRRDERPVNCLTVEQAATFAAWVGARLPTEAEWELAAFSGRDFTYPWGEAPPTCQHLVLDTCKVTLPEAVCSRPAGHSLYDLCDMLGGMWEMLPDAAQPNLAQPGVDGVSLPLGTPMVARGGGSTGPTSIIDSLTNRDPIEVTELYFDVGFRVARARRGGDTQ